MAAAAKAWDIAREKNNRGSETLSKWQFTKGLHDLGNGCYAWLQPDGSWGYSNAGLIVDGKESLLVDTLFDLKLTREMLDGMRKAVPQARRSAPCSTPTAMATTPSATSW